MSTQSEIQVMHQIIQLFEESKMQVDEDLESLPGIYAITDQTGTIYKGNRSLATLFGTNHERLLNMSLARVFTSEDWKTFQSSMAECETSRQTSNDIQLKIGLGEKKTSHYLWNISPIRAMRPDCPPLFRIVGRDMTDLIQSTEQITRMGMELELAGTIQKALFPIPEAHFGFSSISGFSMSASEAGGDWWYYGVFGDKLFLWVGDVEGHGVPAALVTSAVRATVTLIDRIDLQPSKVLPILSRAVFSVATEQKVMTFCVISIDLKTGEFSYASAAHEPGFTVRAKTNEIRPLTCDPSYPLGLDPDYVYKEQSAKLERGDRLIFYTDGIFDVTDKTGGRWAPHALHRKLSPFLASAKTVSDLRQNVQKSITDFRGETALVDDVTFVVFQF